jgi:hypothetical protein
LLCGKELVMTRSDPRRPPAAAASPAARIKAVADGVTAAGFTARLDDLHGSGCVTITAHQPGREDVDIVLDEDGYAKLRWWPGPDAAAGEISGAITRVLTAIAAAPAPGSRAGRSRASNWGKTSSAMPVTIAELRASATVDLNTAARALGLGRTKAYELARRE